MYNWRRGLGWGALGFILAVILSEWFKPSFALLGLLVLLSVSFFILWRHKRESFIYLLGLAILIGSLLGVGRVWYLPQPDSKLSGQVNQTVNLTGRVVTEPEERVSYQQFVLKPVNAKNKVLVRVPPFSSARPGDNVAVSGRLIIPETFYTETGRQFDYPTFLAKDNIFFILTNAELESVSRVKWSLSRALSDIRQLFTGSLNRVLPGTESGLAAGIILGVRQGLSKEVEQAFRTVGLSHIIVLSGFNLAVVAAALGFMLKRFPERVRLLGGATGVILLALLAGGGSAVTRATLMGLLALWAQGAGGTYQALRALGLVAVVMIIWSPLVLLHDLGFQLSVVATAGVIIGPPLLHPKLKFITERLALRDIVTTTISAQVAVAPLIAYSLGTVSLIALPANLLVLLIVPLAMGLAFLTSVFGLISPVLALPVAAPTYLLLHYIISVAEVLSVVPGASIILPL